MSWSGKFKNGESFTDLSDDELNRFESEIDPSTVSENVAQQKLPELPPVPADTQSDYSFVGFANPTTLPKAQKAAEQVMAEQEPGYLSSAFNYAVGEDQENPSWLGRAWRGAANSPLYSHPLETGAGIAAGVLTPMTLGPMAQMAITGGAVGAGNLADQALMDSDTTRTWKERAAEAGGSAAGAGLLSGMGYGLASGLQNYAKPYLKAAGDYVAKMAEIKGFRDWLGKAPIDAAVAEVRGVKKLFPGSGNVDEMMRDVAETKLQELVDYKMVGKDILDQMKQDQDVAKAVAKLVSRKMSDELPQYRVFGPRTASPSTGEIGQYILSRTQEPEAVNASSYLLPDALLRYARRANPLVGAVSEIPLVGRIATGIGDRIGPSVLRGADYIAPTVSKTLGSTGGVAGGILGSEGTRSIQDLIDQPKMPPIF